MICDEVMSLKDTLPRYDKVSNFDMIHVLVKTYHNISVNTQQSYHIKRNLNCIQTQFTKKLGSRSEKSKIDKSYLMPKIHSFEI